MYQENLENFFLTNAFAGNIYFSSHNAVRIVTEKNAVDFRNFPYNLIRSDKKDNLLVF